MFLLRLCLWSLASSPAWSLFAFSADEIPNEYCQAKHTCQNSTYADGFSAHYLCMDIANSVSLACGHTVVLCNTDKFRADILDVYNEYRNDYVVAQYYATGRKIVNANYVNYRLKNEFASYCLAARCLYAKHPKNKWKFGCKQVPKYRYYADFEGYEHGLGESETAEIDETAFTFTFSFENTHMATFDFDNVDMYRKEMRKHPINTINASYPFGKASITSFGCSRRVSKMKLLDGYRANFVLQLVCVVAQEVEFAEIAEEHGDYCTKCFTGQNKCNDKYPNLCGKRRKRLVEYDAPFKLEKNDDMIFSKNGDECKMDINIFLSLPSRQKMKEYIFYSVQKNSL